MILTVTAIQFQLAPDEREKDKRVKVVEEFLAGLRKGQEVMLTAEPENPVDAQAIAAYIDFKRIGYLSKENTEMAYPLLDEDGLCKATIDHHDNHLTLYVSVPHAPQESVVSCQYERTLPESPLGISFRLDFMEQESQLQLVAKCLTRLKVCKENLPEILRLAKQYCSILCLSVCREDALWIGSIDKMLDKICLSRDELGLEAEEAAEFARLYNKVHEAVGDLHCTHEHMPEQIFTQHLDRIRSNKRILESFFKRYCEMFLDGKDFGEADDKKINTERERLRGWLKSMKWSELRNPDNLRMMGYRVNYLRLSRLELYDLYGVLLLIERLNPSSHKAATNSILMSEQAMVYWKRLEEHGFVDAKFKLQESTTRQQAMLIADIFAEKLGIKSKWKTFERFWGIKNLAQEMYHYQETGIISSREKEITSIFRE
ncbi:MAG: HIRAN domain-containing protein [Bacteroidaceae bacterium]|nr:HIRAN domain-containing protein [Bacteroidaceae bacterium]